MKYLFYSFALLFFLSSCKPLQVVRLEPEQEPTSYRYGEKILTEEAADVGVSVSYYDASRNYLVFNLEIENKGDEPFNFEPASCLLVPDVGPVSNAIDPELELLSMDIQTAKETKNRRTWAWIGAGVVVAGSVAAIASENTDVVDNTASAFASDLAFSVTDAITFSVIDAAITSEVVRNSIPQGAEIPVPENRYFWLDHSLRMTTIEPGQKAFGKVVFPRNDEARDFTFQVRVQGREFSFPFSQQVFRP